MIGNETRFPVQSTLIYLDGPISASNKNIVLHNVIASATNIHTVIHRRKYISIYCSATKEVVQVNPDYSIRIRSPAAEIDVVKVIITDDVAALSPVSPHVYGAGVGGLRADIMDIR